MRYAIYFVPAAGSELHDFGARLLGYDPYTGARSPSLLADRADAEALIAEPRRYGLHATLKAPFEMPPARGEPDLIAIAARLAQSLRPITAPPLRIVDMNGFLALVPSASCPSIDAMASACVRTFEPCRAPLSPSDMARRLKAPLTLRQHEQLRTWGYPFVFDDYRFHITLTGRLTPELRRDIEPRLARLYAPCHRALRIDAVSICRQPDRAGPFHVWHQFPLQG